MSFRSLSMSENSGRTTKRTIWKDEIILWRIQVCCEWWETDFDRVTFSSIEYVGTQTLGGKQTDFSEIKATITAILENNKIRSPRRLSVIFKALKVWINLISIVFSIFLLIIS